MALAAVLSGCWVSSHAQVDARTQAEHLVPDSQVLDRVEAVVNNRAILWSDIEQELRLSVLDPERGRHRPLTPGLALQLLISRALIQQQIQQSFIEIAQPSEEDVQARIKELREQLPECVRKNCTTDAGWAAFLKENNLTEAEVATYIGLRLELLEFIGDRFRQGIQIPRDQIEKYYRETLVPQYPKGEQAPPLDTVAPRIEEILLQQQLNTLFTTWLRDLRKQGDVEILDKALEQSATSDEEDNR
ncbi:MAG TPA: peptidylprolyl isomerase [Terracidiphilus sp.]